MTLRRQNHPPGRERIKPRRGNREGEDKTEERGERKPGRDKEGMRPRRDKEGIKSAGVGRKS